MRENILFILKTVNGQVKLAKIVNIYVSRNDDVFLLFKNYKTIEFDESFMCYTIAEESNQNNYLNLKNIVIEKAFKSFLVRGKEYILLMKLSA